MKHEISNADEALLFKIRDGLDKILDDLEIKWSDVELYIDSNEVLHDMSLCGGSARAYIDCTITDQLGQMDHPKKDLICERVYALLGYKP
jgi:hypothetical protein